MAALTVRLIKAAPAIKQLLQTNFPDQCWHLEQDGQSDTCSQASNYRHYILAKDVISYQKVNPYQYSSTLEDTCIQII